MSEKKESMEKVFVDYVVYKGEKATGTLVIKSEKANSPLRVFTYGPKKKYRVGTDIHPRQAQFLTRNHNDLFRLEKIEVKGLDLILADLEGIIPRFQKELGKSAEITFRYISQAVLILLGVPFNKDDPEECLKVSLEILLKGYPDVKNVLEKAQKETKIKEQKEEEPKEEKVLKQEENISEQEEEIGDSKKIIRRRK